VLRRRTRRSLAQQIVKIPAKSGGERHEREERRAAEREHAREGDDAPVERDGADTRKAVVSTAGIARKLPVPEDESERAAERRKDEGFAEQDLEEAQPSGASAARTPMSRCRATERLRIRFATFTHVTSRTSPTAPCTAVSLLMRCLLDKVAEQILFDLGRADFPNTTIDEVVMNIDEGQKNRGTKR
jgi:hypothetical protein